MAKENKPAGMNVAYVANLARLHLTDAEIAEYQGQLDKILEYVNQLRRLDVKDVEPTAHAMPVVNVLRADADRPGLGPEPAMANAPASRNNLFVVPRIIE